MEDREWCVEISRSETSSTAGLGSSAVDAHQGNSTNDGCDIQGIGLVRGCLLGCFVASVAYFSFQGFVGL